MLSSHSKNLEKRSSKVLYIATQNETRTRRCRTNIFYNVGAKIPARLVLYFLSWSGFLVSFMMRNDINFALVAMTRQPGNNSRLVAVEHINTTLTTTDLNALINSNHSTFENDMATLEKGTLSNVSTIAEFLSASLGSANITDNILYSATEAVLLLKEHNNDMNLYDWSSTIKSIIIGSFYWCYVLSQIVGGIATQFFGTKHVFGWSQFVTAFCSLCIPAASDLHFSIVIALRSMQGFASGLTWPAMYAIVGGWIPLAERSRFMSSFQGFSIGIGLTYPLCGFLIKHLGWRYIFYTTGTLGMLWCLMWYLFAFNTPREHPRITPKELEYIEINVSAEIKESLSMKVPWCQIFTSPPALAIGITTFGRIWIHYIFIVCGPNFMKNILGFDYQANGFLSGMPFICSYLSSVFFCYAADKMVLHRWMSLTNVRKLFTAASQIIPGLLIYSIGYIDQNIVVLLIIWFTAVTFITASYAGAMASIVDIAPNFAGPVLAFCQTIHMSASFISPLVSGLIVTNESSIDQWRIVFGISSVVTILTYVVFQIYGTAETQKWNHVQVRTDGSSEESQILKKQTEELLAIKGND